jgi:3-oxoacyl-[acyl-carrier protein] reductase
MDLEGRVALVTGGARGIGAAVAVDLARAGANVAICDLYVEAEVAKVLADVQAVGRRGILLRADVVHFDRAAAVVAEVQQELGALHILVNNAGINRDAVIWKMAEADWDAVIDVDLKGCFNYCRAAAPIFKAQRFGKLVNITSINALRGKVGQSNYAAAKAGMIGLTKTVAKELGRYGVNVNAVAPGFTLTPMTEGMPPEAREAALAEIPLGRPGTPEDVAALVTFLCTERARHITGEVIRIDGGQYI